MSVLLLSGQKGLSTIKGYVSGFLGQNPDINSLHNWRDAGVYGIYQCSQAPSPAIGILEILPYTTDWCVQRYTSIDATSATYQRCWYGGNKWSEWKRIYYTT